ncbi:metal-dependent hydrolase [Chloroflexota bacterium]
MKDDTVKIAYYGVSAFRITTAAGKKILIDPYITGNPLCQKEPDYFSDVDLVLVSHGAFDHLGDAVTILKASGAVLMAGGYDVCRYAMEKGVPEERMVKTIYGDKKEIEGIQIRSVYARHGSKLDGEQGSYYGMPMGFVIRTENNIRIYHGGDTSLFGDMQIISRLYRPNIFLVGVGSVSEGYAFEMEPREAALAAQWIAPEIAIPMHYPPGADNPQAFRDALEIIAPEVEAVLLEPNTEITYHKYRIE